MLSASTTTEPVTDAIRAVRPPYQDDAINRLLTGGEPLPALAIERRPFGPNREHLRLVSVSGLVALYDAYGTAADVFTHQANAPRVDGPAGTLLDDAAEAAHVAREEIVAEIEARQPTSTSDQCRRLGVLIVFHANGGEWGAVQALAVEAMGRVQA